MDITKALTIRVGADVYPFTTAIAAAGESLVWLTGKMKDLANFAKEGLIDGGALAESTAGLTQLSKQYGMTADDVLRSFDRVTDGQMGLMEMTQRTTKALQMGFSPEQTAVIWEFARKYTDAVGGSMEDVAGRIEVAIAKGRVKTLAEFGIMAKDGTAALEMLRVKASELGDGAFNFGDSFKQITNSVADMSLAVWEQLNNIVGTKGFAGFAQRVRDIFWSLKAEAGVIAAGIFSVAKTLIEPVYEMVSSLFGMVSTNFLDTSATWKSAVKSLAEFVVGTVYDVTAIAAGAIATISTPLLKIGEYAAMFNSTISRTDEQRAYFDSLKQNLQDFGNVQDIIFQRKQQQLENLNNNFASALAATTGSTATGSLPTFTNPYSGDQIRPTNAGASATSQAASQAVSGSKGAQIVINVPKGDKIGAAIRDWLTIEAINEGMMRAGV